MMPIVTMKQIILPEGSCSCINVQLLSGSKRWEYKELDSPGIYATLPR